LLGFGADVLWLLWLDFEGLDFDDFDGLLDDLPTT